MRKNLNTSKLLFSMLIVVVALISLAVIGGGKTEAYDYKWVKQSNGYIAHALGDIDGYAYTNSLEAFERNIKKGYKCFEVDLSLTDDGEIVLRHDLGKWYAMIGNDNYPNNYTVFKKCLLYGKYHTMDLEELMCLLAKNKDIYLIIDHGGREKEEAKLVYETVYRKASKYKGVLNRIELEVLDQEMLDIALDVYQWKSVILAYDGNRWIGDTSTADFINFCKKNHIGAVSVNSKKRDIKNFTKAVSDNGIKVLVYTVNDKDELLRLKQYGAEAVYTDVLITN